MAGVNRYKPVVKFSVQDSDGKVVSNFSFYTPVKITVGWGSMNSEQACKVMLDLLQGSTSFAHTILQHGNEATSTRLAQIIKELEEAVRYVESERGHERSDD